MWPFEYSTDCKRPQHKNVVLQNINEDWMCDEFDELENRWFNSFLVQFNWKLN